MLRFNVLATRLDFWLICQVLNHAIPFHYKVPFSRGITILVTACHVSYKAVGRAFISYIY